MRITDQQLLHADFRNRVRVVKHQLEREGIPLEVYETARSPWRQQSLYAQGRDVPGKIVTRARPWFSKHQYGAACDFVFKVMGKWTWQEPEKGMWDRYVDIVLGAGLISLSFERPHCEMPWTLSELRSHLYAADGGADWKAWLGRQIEVWTGCGLEGAPPDLEIADRPELAVGGEA